MHSRPAGLIQPYITNIFLAQEPIKYFNKIIYVRAKNFLSNDVVYVFEVVAVLTHCEIKTFGAHVVSSNSYFVLHVRLG